MINRVTVRAFRGVCGTEVFEPETLTVLTGRNGLGKTTFFDAVDWCLFGQASRFGPEGNLIKNLYRPEADPLVEVVLTIGNNAVKVRRTENAVTLNGVPVSERELAEALIADPEVFPPYLRDLGRQVRTVTYLSQEQIREFVGASLSSERRALLQGLLGVPNAGIVESSIRRIRDHFAVREKNLVEQIDSITHELLELTTTIDFDSTVERDTEDFLTSFRRLYGDRSASVKTLRSALEADLAKRSEDAVAVDTVISSLRAGESTIAQAEREIEVLEERHRELSSRAADAGSKLRQSADAIARAVEACEDSKKKMAAQEAQVASLSLMFSNKQRLEELENDLAKRNRERDSLTTRIATLVQSAESLRLELNAAQELADERQRQLKLVQERAEIESHHADIESRLNALRLDRLANEADLTEATRAHAASSKEMEEALEAKNRAVASHDLASRSAQRTAQIADLRARLINLIDISESNCPLCGALYETRDRLIQHVHAYAKDPEIDDRLQYATTTLQAAEATLRQSIEREKLRRSIVEERRTAIEEVDRETARLRVQYENLSRSLEKLGEKTDMRPSADESNKVDELRTTLQGAERARFQLENDLSAVDFTRNRFASELESLKSGLTPALLNVEAITVAEAREAISPIRKAVDDNERMVQGLRNTNAALESSTADIRSQIASVGGRLQAERERKRRALEDFDRQCVELGIVAADTETKGLELRRRAEGLGVEVARIRNAIAHAKTIESRQIINENIVKHQEREKRLAQTHESLSVLRQAQDRFQQIAKQLAARSKIEAESAGIRHLAAVQECLNDLYPHLHLNEVELDFAKGELLVKDHWLRNGVRPQDYSSTGQANILALAVFLGLALRQTFSLARFLLLDEPVQNLDDLHFLAFLTLLKRVALSRQVIISTADSNIAELLRRQLRSWTTKGRGWCEYRWVAFQPETGPTIKRYEGKQIAVA